MACVGALEDARYELESQGIIGIVVPPADIDSDWPVLEVLEKLYDQWTEGAANRLARAKQFGLFSPAHMIYTAEAQVLAACAEEIRNVILTYEPGITSPAPRGGK